MIKFRHKGDFEETKKFLSAVGEGDYLLGLSKYGEIGVQALMAATPKKTGKTAASWSYSIQRTKKGLSISWDNSNVNNGVNVALLIQYGHGTPQGYYVQGVDYINPALAPLFDTLGKEVWEEVTRSGGH